MTAPAIEEQIVRAREAFAALRATLEDTIAPLFKDPADAVAGLLTNADIYGSDAAVGKMQRGLNIISPPAPLMQKAAPDTCTRAKSIIDKLMELHQNLDLLNSAAQKFAPASGSQRIFIQGEPYALKPDGSVERVPEPKVEIKLALEKQLPVQPSRPSIGPGDDQDEPEPSV